MEQSRSALSAIEDLLTSQSSGRIFSSGTWEMLITMRPNAWLGRAENIHDLNNLRSGGIIRVS